MHMRTSTTAGTAVGLPGVDEIRAELERILSSQEFPGTGRTATFLRYVIEETLAGRASRIKGYTIAIEVFGRDETFTQDDPVVRIEAGRLRRSLERYYLVEGHRDPVRIDIPKGGYAPSFSWNVAVVATQAAPAIASPASTPAIGRWRAHGPVFAGFAAVLAVAAYWIAAGLASGPSRPLDDAVRDMPTVVVAPFANLDGGPDAQLYSIGLTEELLTVLPRFKEIKVFGRETSKSLSSDIDVSKVREELGARYLLAGGVRASPNRMRVTARLIDTADGEILWSREYDKDLASGDLFAIQADVARQVATAIAQPYGVMAQVDAANPPPDDLGAYECTLRFYAYRSELSAEAHAGARDCLVTTVGRYPTYSTAWAMLSIVYLDEDRFKFNIEPGSEPPMHRALNAARRATQLDGNNTRALQALMMALFFNQDLTEAMRVGEQALATNPHDTELMGEFGTRMAIGGQWRRGAALLDQAIALNPAGGGYYQGTRALAAYMLNDNATAVRAIAKADMQKFPLYHAVAAVIYAEAGMMEDARREGKIFALMRPDFLPNIVAELTARNVQPGDQSRLMAGLRKAGLMLPRDVANGVAVAVGTSDLQPR